MELNLMSNSDKKLKKRRTAAEIEKNFMVKIINVFF